MAITAIPMRPMVTVIRIMARITAAIPTGAFGELTGGIPDIGVYAGHIGVLAGEFVGPIGAARFVEPIGAAAGAFVEQPMWAAPAATGVVGDNIDVLRGAPKPPGSGGGFVSGDCLARLTTTNGL